MRSPIPGSKSAAPKTPAQRLIELQAELAHRDRQIAAVQFEETEAKRKLSRFTSIGGVSFGGIPMSQSWAELVLWESLLNDRKFRAVYELGTWEGGFAWWMWAQAKRRGITFHTFDAVRPQAEPPPDTFTQADVFIQFELLGTLLLAWEPLILFCDNGNKPREVEMYGPVLQHPDSLIVVHDWGTEIQPEDIPDCLEMIYEDFCKDLGSMSRVFKRRSDDL